MLIYKTKAFSRQARREGILDGSLESVVADAERGLIEADLGSGIIKQRLARPGKGKSGGYRTLLAFRSEKRAVFLYVFAKKDLGNITSDQLETLKDIAGYWLSASADAIRMAIEAGEIERVGDEEDDEEE